MFPNKGSQPPDGHKVEFQDWGVLDYQVAWNKQEKMFAEVVKSKIDNRNRDIQIPTNNYLIFVEHPHVYTLGKSGKPENLLLDANGLKEKNSSFYKINRGGDITYHGLGQLVAYPILDLDNFFTDIHLYLRTLEEAIILTLLEFNIMAGRSKGLTGVWIDSEKPTARKISALGVRCSRWVTMHGLALNINTDLSYFDNIIPCGINDKDVTSMKKELGYEVNMESVKSVLKKNIGELFKMEFI